MESLFLYRDQGNRRKQFIRTYSEAIAGAASDDDGILLSSIALSDDYHLDDEEEASLADRGLIERKKNGTLKITETGMKAVSVYPLMGKKSSRKMMGPSTLPCAARRSRVICRLSSKCSQPG